jgi:hypothetical protein
MRPGHRVVAQAVHRGVSLAALAALAAHIGLEIVAHRSHAIDAVVPFLARRRPLYIGLGTVSWDLFVLIVITGFARGRFAGRWPWAWRSIHAIAYLAWPLAIVHGLLAGRAARPYVDWSYGACLAAVALALAVRAVATLRASEEKIPHPVPDRLSVPAEGLVPGARVAMAPLGSASPGLGGAPRRALPAGQQAGAAGPARMAEVSRITRPGEVLSADLTDPGSWRSPREWQSPPERPAAGEYPVAGDYAAGDFAAGRYPATGDYAAGGYPSGRRYPAASQEWPASPDWPTSPGWKAEPDEYDR